MELKSSQVEGLTTANTIPQLFENKKVLYVHKGRTAIRLACELLGLGRGCEILAPSYNCGSEIDALLSSGAHVRLYRINREALIDTKDMENKISKQTKAVYITHYFGFPQNADAVSALGKRYGLHLIEDCALTLLSANKGEMIGTAGDISVFSLPKTLPVPDGGIIMINNKSITIIPEKLSSPRKLDILLATLPLLKATAFRILRVKMSSFKSLRLGKPDQTEKVMRVQQKMKPEMPVGYYYDEKYTGKGISQFSRRLVSAFDAQKIKEARRRNYLALAGLINRHEKVSPLFSELPDEICPLYFPLLVEKRDEAVTRLKQQGIDARAWWRGYHKELPWADFPDACFLKDHILALPVHQDLSNDAMNHIARCTNGLNG